MEKEVRLKLFYNQLYEQEDRAVRLINYTKFPLTGNEAAYKFFIDNFKGGDILEVGAGSGDLARSLLASDLDIRRYVALEYSRPRAKKLKQRIEDSRFEVIEGNIEELDKDIGRFDAVVMIALIEHLVDPLGTMRFIKENLLKPNGFVYINTPNFANIGCRRKLLFGHFPSTASKDEGLLRYDGKPVNLYDEGHLHYFTFSSLRGMLERYCGFKNFQINPQIIGKTYFGRRFHYLLARMMPTLFSDLNLVAW
jgi:2-polyprenyl-3-methyl-5-hydroxy-6-metoxy-1,4-benzoquinol methylase